MAEQVFRLTKGNEKTIEKVIQDENLHYLHMIFNRDEGTPEHHTNSTVYMTVVRGKLSIQLDSQELKEYDAGTVLKIPFDTNMIAKNLHQDSLELIIVKVPAPKG